MAGPEAAVKLTEDQVDDLIYFARTGDLEEVRGTIEETARAAAGGGATEAGDVSTHVAVLAAAVDAESGNTPLHMAAANGHDGVLSYLLAVLKTSPTPPQSTPLASDPNAGEATSPSQDKSATTEAADSSVSKTASNNAPPPSSSSTNSTASPSNSLNTTAATAANSVHPLINHANASLSTPLHWAALNGRLSSVRLLIAAGANPGLENAARHDALDEAERAGHVEVVRFLLAKLGGKKEEDVVMAGEGKGDNEDGNDDDEGEEDASTAAAAEQGDLQASSSASGGVKVTQQQLERLGLEDTSKRKG